MLHIKWNTKTVKYKAEHHFIFSTDIINETIQSYRKASKTNHDLSWVCPGGFRADNKELWMASLAEFRKYCHAQNPWANL